jgi:hypothetical protein
MKIKSPAFPTNLNSNMLLGMSLRDYFAAAAMHCYLLESMNDNERDSEPMWIARFSYEMADEMLKAREE